MGKMDPQKLEYHRKWRAAHREAINEQHRLWYRKNIERQRELNRAKNRRRVEYSRQYRQDHKEKIQKYVREWVCAHPLNKSVRDYKNRKRGVPYELPTELHHDLVTDNCYYCGAAPNPLNGIDRVDNSKGYVLDNVVTACKWCNRAKFNRSKEDFERWILTAARHLEKFIGQQ